MDQTMANHLEHLRRTKGMVISGKRAEMKILPMSKEFVTKIAFIFEAES